jgi:hypothetical protein
MPLGGKDLSEYMNQMLTKPGILDGIDDDTFVFDVDAARVIKEQFCVVA